MLGSNSDDKGRRYLRVKEAAARDVGRGIARMDPEIERKMDLVSGDVLEIMPTSGGKPTKPTYALYWRGFPEDRGSNAIRLDGEIRRNANVSIDDRVTVRKVEAKIANKLVLAPVEPVRISGGAEDYFKSLLNGRVLTQGDFFLVSVMRSKIGFMVVDQSPKGPVIVDQQTEIKISEKVANFEDRTVPRITYDQIGGLSSEINKIREMIELPMKHPELFDRLGIEAPKGVLLHGPPGTGKTLLAKAIANETDSSFYSISGPEIMSKFYGESEKQLRARFEEAEENAPSIIFIDELDSIAPKREDVSGEVERRVVAQLLSLMDGLKARGRLVVIGASNRPNALDPALRRGGRFDREIEIGIPDKDGRAEILAIHTRGMPLEEDVDISTLASQTHGFVGADIETLAKEAAMNALRRVMPEINLEEESIPVEVLEKIKVQKRDFQAAMSEVEPSALREVFVEIPDMEWNDIGGLDDAKLELQEAVEWPLKYLDLYQGLNAPQTKGILLYGLPGTGKTMLAKAVANQSEANFISIKGPEFLSKWVGESEKAVRETFRKARQSAPCVIFMDEIESIVPVRGSNIGSSQVTERVISQLLTELDGLEELHGVVVVAATNRPDIIDPALLRPGRFDKLIEIGMPDNNARREIFKIHMRNKPLADDVNIEALAEKTEGFNGADIAAVVSEATMRKIRLQVQKGEVSKDQIRSVQLTQKDFFKGIDKIQKMHKQKTRVTPQATPKDDKMQFM